MRSETGRHIAFDRRKYGRLLQVDACTVRSIRDFISTPEPHRLGFYEIALVTAGRGRLELDGDALEVAPYRVCLTRPGETRRWRLDDHRVDGLLAFFEADFLDGCFAEHGVVAPLPAVSSPAPLRSLAVDAPRFDRLMDLVGAMVDEIATLRDDSTHLLRAQVSQLLVQLQRAGERSAAGDADAAARLASRFAAMSARRPRMGDSVADYAAALGTSTRILNRCLRAALGCTAGELLQRQVLREARRLLLHSDLTMAAIAERLEFSDVSYFSRFVRRRVGLPPGRFRAEQRSASHDTKVHCPPAERR